MICCCASISFKSWLYCASSSARSRGERSCAFDRSSDKKKPPSASKTEKANATNRRIVRLFYHVGVLIPASRPLRSLSALHPLLSLPSSPSPLLQWQKGRPEGPLLPPFLQQLLAQAQPPRLPRPSVPR